MRRPLFDDADSSTANPSEDPAFAEFRSSFRRFVEAEIVPHAAKWDADGIVSRELFLKAGRHGFLGFAAPLEHGGGGVDDFRYNLIVAEEIAAAGVHPSGFGITLHNDICLPYFIDLTNDDQKARWLPGICRGELITAVAMTEPGVGSDLASMSTTAVLDGDHYVVNGSKTFITNGVNSHLVITAVKTDLSQRHAGMSLLVIEDGMEGFSRGRNLDKIGLHAQDTAELFFDDVRVPVANRIGSEGAGFGMLVGKLAQERLSLAAVAVAGARFALDETLAYVKERTAFGKPIGQFQNSRFALAEMATEIDIAQSFVDRCVLARNAGDLTVEDAAKAKWWCTEMQGRVVDRCVQLFGGYGYMTEYPISQAFTDARISRIWGGTTEIMKEVIGRSLGI